MKAKGYSYYSPVLEPVNEEDGERQGQVPSMAQFNNNNNNGILCSLSSDCVCVCVFSSAHQSAGEREKVREKTSRFIQLEWACSCALHRLMISPLPPQSLHSVLSVAEVGQSKRPRGLSVPVNTSSTFRRSA